MNPEIKQLLVRPIAFQPILARLCGDILAGLMLSQALYWSERTTQPGGWFYKTQHEWTDETCLSRCEQERARRTLRSFDFWQECRRGVPAKLFFHLDREKLAHAVSQFAENQQTSLRFQSKQDCGYRSDQTADNRQPRSRGMLAHKEQRSPETTPQIPQRTGNSAQRTRRSFPLPVDFAPKDSHRKLAAHLQVDLDLALESFCDYHASKASLFADWDRAFNTWLRNENKFAQKGTTSIPYGNRAQQRQNDNIAAADEAAEIFRRRMAQ